MTQKNSVNRFFIWGLAMGALLLSAVNVVAQQEWSYTQYQFNLYDANSAYAGSHQTMSIALRHRSQWIGLEGAPATDQLSLHAPIAAGRMGVGFRVVSDRIGARRQQMVKGSASYRLRLYNGHLSMGITGGLLRNSIDRTDLTVYDMNDAQLVQLGDARLTPVVGAAIMYSSQRMFFGVESGALNTSPLASEPGALARMYRRANAIAGYIQPIGESDLLEISAQVKWSEGAILQSELNVQYLFRNKCWFGGGYRWNSAWQLLGAWMINDQLRIGLSYDNTAGKLMNCNQSSAELFVGYTLQKRTAGSVRYF